jgi:Tfp pilus assembly protein PilN
MHTIDLLKGQGLPAKTTLGSVFFTVLMFVVPLLVGAGMAGFYLINKTEIDIKQGQIDGLKKSTEDLKPKVAQTEKLARERDLYTARLTEVSKCVDTYQQWTPVLIAVSENMPENMIMNKLAVINDEGRGAGRRNSDPNKPLTIPIPQRKMTAELSGKSGTDTFNTKVQEYQKKLKSEPSLSLQLKDLTYQMQAASGDNPQDSFTMSFVFEKQKK